jgi:hypothetical protein
MTVESPWMRLTEWERQMLIHLLGVSAEEDEVAAATRFSEILLEESERAASDSTIIDARLLTLRNLMKQMDAGGSESLWNEVVSLRGIRSSYIELLVADRDRLIDKLRDQAYVINREPFWSIHEFDSARAVTTYSDQPSLHFANDRADEPEYGPNYFFVHWDVTSVWFRLARRGRGFLSRIKLVERLRSALRHKTGFADPETVRAYLDSRRNSEAE